MVDGEGQGLAPRPGLAAHAVGRGCLHGEAATGGQVGPQGLRALCAHPGEDHRGGRAGAALVVAVEPFRGIGAHPGDPGERDLVTAPRGGRLPGPRRRPVQGKPRFLRAVVARGARQFIVQTPLGAGELLLELALSGNVFPDAQQVAHRPLGIHGRGNHHPFPDAPAVLGCAVERALPDRAGGDRGAKLAVRRVARVALTEKGPGGFKRVFEGKPGIVAVRGVHVAHMAGGRGEQNAHRGLLDGLGQFGQMVFGEAMAGHIAPDQTKTAGDRGGFPLDPAPALRALPTLLVAARRRARRQGGQARGERGFFVGRAPTDDSPA